MPRRQQEMEQQNDLTGGRAIQHPAPAISTIRTRTLALPWPCHPIPFRSERRNSWRFLPVLVTLRGTGRIMVLAQKNNDRTFQPHHRAKPNHPRSFTNKHCILKSSAIAGSRHPSFQSIVIIHHHRLPRRRNLEHR